MFTSQAAGAPTRRNARAAILNAARRLYFAHGADGVSARRIAQAAGCSATALYVYYRSVGDLLEHLRIEGHGLLAARLRRVDAALPAVEQIRAMGRAYFEFGVKQPQYYALMFSLRPAETPGRAAVQREMHTLMLLRDAVRRGIDRREIRTDLDVMVLTNALWAEIHGVTALAVSRLLVETAPGQQDDVLEAVLDAALRWLAPARRRVNTVKRRRGRRC